MNALSGVLIEQSFSRKSKEPSIIEAFGGATRKQGAVGGTQVESCTPAPQQAQQTTNDKSAGL